MHILGFAVILFSIWLVFMVGFSYREFRLQWQTKTHGARAPPSFWAWLSHQFVTLHRYQKFAEHKGAMNIGGVMMLGISMVFLAIGFIFLPITTNAASSLLTWSYSANADITAASFTGFTSVVGITPLLILVGFLAAAVITGMMGIRIMKGSGGGRADPGSLMLLGLSIVFIGVGLIIEPVMLDGVSSVLHGTAGAGISSSFTGYEAIIKVSPMLVHLGFLASAVLSGFFGIKRLGSAASD